MTNFCQKFSFKLNLYSTRTLGYDDDAVTIGYHYITVPEEDRANIIDEYFELYQSYFGADSLNDLSDAQAKVLAGLINGDVWCRKPSMEQAEIYKNAGTV